MTNSDLATMKNVRSIKEMEMRIIRWVAFIGVLSLMLLAPFSAYAQEKSHVTSAQMDSAIREVEKLAQKQIQENALPGLAIAVVFQDKVLYAKGFGVRDVNTKAAVDADTVFQLASVSKSIGSTVVAELVGEGKITWDSKLCMLDPAFAMFDPWVTREITIRDMYAHRSGLPEHAGDLLEEFGFSRAEILHRLRYQHPESSFRSHYAYTNFGMTEGRRRGSESVRAGVGRGGQTKIVQPARHDFDEFALRGFCRTHEQGVGTRAGGWQIGAKVQTRPGRAIARGRGEFFCK